MKYFYIQPEVAGGFGENTVLDTSVHPPIVSRLHYELDGWLGDVLLETFPCFIITKDAKTKLQSIGATGIRLDDVEITTSVCSWVFILIESFQNSFGYKLTVNLDRTTSASVVTLGLSYLRGRSNC